MMLSKHVITQVCNTAYKCRRAQSGIRYSALRPFIYPTPPPVPEALKNNRKLSRAEIYIGRELYQARNTEYAWEVLERAGDWLAPEWIQPEQSCVTASLAHDFYRLFSAVPRHSISWAFLGVVLPNQVVLTRIAN